MKVGDIIKLEANPSIDWMHNYLEEFFEIVDFPTETGVLLRMVGSDPAWFWHVGKDNFKIVEEKE